MCLLFIFFFNDTATTEIYTLSLHDALPISFPFLSHLRRTRKSEESRNSIDERVAAMLELQRPGEVPGARTRNTVRDRKSTRLNSSHSQISYAVFCLKKKTTPIAS